MRIRKVHSRWVVGGAGLGLILTMVAGTSSLSATTSAAATNRTTTTSQCVGAPQLASSEPSRVLPLGLHALPGFTRSYCLDFPGTTLPTGWDKFTGQPKGDPASLFEPWHVSVRGGLLRINTYRDQLEKWKWTSGGVCQCGLARAYGAYYVRSRITAVGASSVLLLWPKNNTWPPEVDFLETWTHPNTQTSTLHFPIQGNPGDHKVQKTISVNLKEWHTWGVVWTPTTIKFSVGTYTYWTITDRTEVPRTPMTLDIQQQSWCGIFPGGCPMFATSLLVDWVAEYVPTKAVPTHVTSTPGIQPAIPTASRP